MESYWDDLRVSADMIHFRGVMKGDPPEKRVFLHNSERGPSFSGLRSYAFRRGRNGHGLYQSGYFSVQLPHSYQEGTSVEPHVHVRLLPGDEAKPGQKLLLELEYSWVNIAEPVPVSSRIVSVNYEITEENLTQDNLLISFGHIEKPDARISSMITCRFSRVTIDPGWPDHWSAQGVENDSFEGDLLLYEFDFHYRRDSRGSREIYTK